MTTKHWLAIAVAALLGTGCSSLTPAERQAAYQRYLQRQERARMERWELNRAASCEQAAPDTWRCAPGAP